MPDLKDLEQFKKVLTNLSGEPEWRAQKGEAITDSYLENLTKSNPKSNSKQADNNDVIANAGDIPSDDLSLNDDAVSSGIDGAAADISSDFDLPSSLDMPSSPAEDGAGDNSFDLPSGGLDLPDMGGDAPASSDNSDPSSDFDLPNIDLDGDAAGSFDLPAEAADDSFGDVTVPDLGSDIGARSTAEDGAPDNSFDLPSGGLGLPDMGGDAPGSSDGGADISSDFDLPDLGADIEPAAADAAADGSASAGQQEDDLNDIDLPDLDDLVSSSGGDDDLEFSFEKEPTPDDDDYYAELEEGADAPMTGNLSLEDLTAAAAAAKQELAENNGASSPEKSSQASEGGEDHEPPMPATSDTFDLTDFGDALSKVDGKEKPAAKAVASAPSAASAEGADLFFRKYDLDRMEHTLSRLPRNLKIAVEEILASPETPVQAVRQLTDKLMAGASARSIADEVRTTSGRTIIVPLFYQKGTGETLEKRKRGFVHVFATQAWPVLKKISLTMLMVAAGILAAFHFIYRPGMADYYYNSGYKHLLKGNYDEAERLFSVAFHGWKLGFINVKGVRKQSWFYKYADAYAQQRQFGRAVQKYEDLLQNYPNSKKAYMAYAHFEGSVHARYAEADRIYWRYLTNIDPSDTEVLLAAGDNLFEWGAIEPEKTELARQVYADLQYKLGHITPTLGIRFLRYAIREDNRPEIERWSRYFLTYMPKKRGFQVEPVTFSELAGWYLDNNQPGVAREILDMAMEKAPENPYVLYQMARYYSDGGLSASQEEQMLQRTYYALMQYESLTWQQTDMLVDVYRRLGMLYMSQSKNNESEENFKKAVSTYEDAVRGKVLVPREKYGKIYKEFADLYYEKKFDYDSALIYMNQALKNFYDTPELRYKLGYVYFLKKDFKDALDNFYLSFENAQDNMHVLFSYATTLAERGSYSAAEGVYDQLRIALERKNSADESMDPAMTPEQKRKIVDLLAKTYNNLGVVRYWLSQSTREVSRYRTLAETNLGQAVIYWDQLTRDPETAVRVQERGLPQTNFRAITYPSAQLEIGLFNDLPRQFPFSSTQQEAIAAQREAVAEAARAR